ncbi:MAG TPA: helix-turn-helix domain-containing protein [Puia sp.]
MINHDVKKLSYPVNARKYLYEGDHAKVPLNRNGFYKIWLIENHCRIHINDNVVTCNDPVLFFANPFASYAYDSLQKRRSGYWCVFTNEFLAANDPSGKIRAMPALGPTYAAVVFPAPAQLAVIKWLFQQLTEAAKAEFAFRNEMMFNYIQLLIFEGMKAEARSLPVQKPDAAVRITRQFLQLLERQFPVQSPDRPVKFCKPADFADRLAIHVNHLNEMVRKVTGETTTRHITVKRITEAKALLRHSDWPIADVSAGLGFEYPNHFHAFFKRNTGHTPLGYRKSGIL